MISVIVCAAGRGARAGFSRNKLLEECNGLPLLAHTLSAFSGQADEMLVTCSEEDEAAIGTIVRAFPHARTVRGGATRGESVKNALAAVRGEIVLVHDGARPFVSPKVIGDCIDSVRTFGSGVCALPATDTTVIARDGQIVSAPDREEVFTVQTPQGFYTEELRLAYERAGERVFTDESSLFAAYVRPPRLFPGDRANRKLTYPEDFRFAERVGFGVDTHAFGEGDHILLGGVKIPSERGLIAHSDGDVLAHAVTDALLSAAGLKDIGTYFPDTDPAYAGADSMQLLGTALTLAEEKGYRVKNLSVSVLAETPRLAPYIDAIRASLASALSLPPDGAAVAAGTNEKLGYVGEGKGITVYAMLLLCGK